MIISYKLFGSPFIFCFCFSIVIESQIQTFKIKNFKLKEDSGTTVSIFIQCTTSMLAPGGCCNFLALFSFISIIVVVYVFIEFELRKFILFFGIF